MLKALDEAEIPCDIQLLMMDPARKKRRCSVRSVERLMADHPRLLPAIYLPSNRGKGYAVRAGMENASRYTWIGFVDADGAVPASEVCRVLMICLRSSSLPRALFGSRVRMLGRRIERSFARHLAGRVFASLVGVMVSPLVYDSQCGLKMISTGAYERIRPRLQEDGFCFDVEVLAALLDSGVPVEEVPIDWCDQPGSKVSFFRDAWAMFLALRRIQARRDECCTGEGGSSINEPPV
jgi:glycosyltransferase involved in cell wall biosynthesis